MKKNHISKQKASIFKNGIIQKCYYFIFFLLFTFFQVQSASAVPPQIGSIADGLTACTSFNITVTEVYDSQYMWTNNQAADVVLGQSDFISSRCVAVDPTTGKVFVSETLNHRILRFSSTICKKQAEKSENNHKIRDLYSLILNQ